ncbi:hypothetical protein Aau02nite_29420 [Amorphoplanes auranticolor]|uniref:Uncharacterized protein n=1 Tax=Actinoplanes auranticolor TaxID=47988 RepID=A0A919VJ57_9ACTN|nr:hypothetical protein Aau02nite_29420 [Actinoplanes auranticolor]
MLAIAMGTSRTRGPAHPGTRRRGFRKLRAKTTRPASAPKSTTAGPGLPAGSKNRRPATRYDVGKRATKRGITLNERTKRTGQRTSRGRGGFKW